MGRDAVGGGGVRYRCAASAEGGERGGGKVLQSCSLTHLNAMEKGLSLIDSDNRGRTAALPQGRNRVCESPLKLTVVGNGGWGQRGGGAEDSLLHPHAARHTHIHTYTHSYTHRLGVSNMIASCNSNVHTLSLSDTHFSLNEMYNRE